MKKKWKVFLTVLASASLLLAACGDEGEKASSSKTYNIGVTQIAEHPSLNAAYDGFKRL